MKHEPFKVFYTFKHESVRAVTWSATDVYACVQKWRHACVKKSRNLTSHPGFVVLRFATLSTLETGCICYIGERKRDDSAESETSGASVIWNLCVNIIKESRILDRYCLKAAATKRSYSKTASTPSENDEKSTHFGFQTIKESEKTKKVYAVFENVANSYDLMNDSMSMGIHRIWKDIFIQELGPTHGTHLLDSAGGTGDITFRYINFLRNTPNPHNVRSHVTVCDINQHMLDVGEKRASKLGLSQDSNCDIAWKQEDAEKLSFSDDSFSAYTIAFGVRNTTHIDKVLSEAYRVLQPGGRFLCLEFSHMDNKLLQWLYDQYSFQIIPVMGQLIVGEWKAYQYLVESIRKFPKQEDFKNMIEFAGFRNVTYQNLTFGMVAIHSGFKL